MSRWKTGVHFQEIMLSESKICVEKDKFPVLKDVSFHSWYPELI